MLIGHITLHVDLTLVSTNSPIKFSPS